MKFPKTVLHKITRWLWYLLAGIILFSAVIISILRFALTEVDSYREKVQLIASQATHHRVLIESLDAHLVGLTPTLILRGIHILDEDGDKEILRVNESSIGISLLQSWRNKTFVPKDVTLSGTKLALVRRKNGQIGLRGFDLAKQPVKQEGNKDLTQWFFSQTSLALKDSTVVWKDYQRNTPSINLTNVDIELLNSGKTHQLTGTFSPSASLGKKVEVALDIKGDLTKPAQWQGKFFVQGDEIYLTRWGESINYSGSSINDGIADFQVWGEWNAGQLSKVDGDVSVYQLVIAKAGENKKLDIGLLGGLFKLRFEEKGWSLAVQRFQYTGTGGVLPESDFSIEAKNNDEGLLTDIDVRVEKFAVQSVVDVLINSGVLTSEQQALMDSLKPSGNINTLRVSRSYDQQTKGFHYAAYARFDKLSYQNYKKIPGLENVSGSLWLDQHKGILRLDSSQGSIDFGKLFRAPIKLEKVTGNLEWWRFKNGWQVKSNELQAENNEVTSLTNFSVYIPDTGPAYMDLYSAFAGSAQYKSHYLPVGIMKERLVNWVDNSIVSGVVSNGGAVYRGRLKDFPFRDPTGQFLVQLYTDNLVLDYQKNWPVINDIDMDASFDSKGIAIDISLGRLFSSAVTNTSIKIADFREPAVDISGQVTGGMADVVRFVVDSPIPGSKELLDINYSGRATTDVGLHIPLAKGQAIGYSGTVNLDRAGIALLGGAVDIEDINGELAFSNAGINSDNLTAKIFGNRSKLNIYSQVVDNRNKTYLATNGVSDSVTVLKSFSLPAYKHVSGEFGWQALLDFSDDQERVPVLSVTSELEGVEVKLPEPFNKEKNDKRSLDLQAYFKGNGTSELFVGYGKNFSLSSRMEAGKKGLAIQKGHLHFAPGSAKLPKNNLLYITGSIQNFSPAAWGKHSAAYEELGLSKTAQLPVYLKMNKLDVLLEEHKDDQPVNALPNSFPAISGSIEQLVFDGMPLGKLDVKLKPHQSGMTISKMNISSAEMNFTSSGQWNFVRNQHQTNLSVGLKSKDMGKLFKRLGLAAIINNGKADINGELHWTGTPFDMSLEKLKGQLNLYIAKGSIADVDPGAGRVVGLLSLSELPRRLMLDFSDMFKKGFVFDEIKGAISLNNGNAYTKGINVDGAAAEVNLQGRTGLVNRDYDQTVKVIPKVGDTLPVASGALFGTQIGALVYLFEKIMGKELEKATEREYKVTGSWEKPVIKRMDKPVAEKPANK